MSQLPFLLFFELFSIKMVASLLICDVRAALFQVEEYCSCPGKRAHVESGTTPNKPDKKRSTPVRGTTKKSLFPDLTLLADSEV